MSADGTAAIAQSPEELRAQVKAQVVEGKPTFFKLEAKLPRQGRTDTPLAASDKMGRTEDIRRRRRERSARPSERRP